VLTWRLRDYPEARRLVEEARESFAAVANARGQGWALSFLANIAGSQQDDDAALRFGAEALALFRELDDRVGLARVLNGLAEAARYFGDDARARAFYEEGLALDREAGNQQGIALKLQNLAHVALHEGRLEEAVDQLGESLTLHEQIGHRAAFFCFLEGMAAIASAAGLFDEAATLYGAWQALAIKLDSHALDPPDQRDADHYLKLARDHLKPEGFAVVWERGQNLSFDEAMATARAAGQRVRQARLKTAGECVSVTPLLKGLSRREREVLAVLARGATNREIASTLGIAPRTVDTHVGAILRKLGVATREDAGRLAVDQGLAAAHDD
jgi:non-specific serine/threonine protein kinase